MCNSADGGPLHVVQSGSLVPSSFLGISIPGPKFLMGVSVQEVSVQEVSVQGVSVKGGLCPGVSVEGSLSRWALCPGGSLSSWALYSGDSVQWGVSIERGFLSRGFLYDIVSCLAPRQNVGPGGLCLDGLWPAGCLSGRRRPRTEAPIR